uniref:G-protein coupled receptors family 1 profile domain-containing protein n=1 Tax=Globodera rostochiensis TaxID=31243 RepID=A0A914HWH7_GLORO
MKDTDFNANNTLYQMYRNVYPCWPFIIGAVTINLVALFGMISNFGVIWVTYCTKTLHGTANFLIALYSFFELLHQHGHWLFLYTALSGQNFLPLTLAIRICTVSLFGLGGTAMSMTFTGLDRLLCVLFPTFPRKVKPLPYLCAIMLLCISVSTFLLNIYYESVSKMPNLMITGTIGDLLKNVTSQRLSSICFVMHSITIVLYVVVGIVVKKKSFSNSSNAEKKQRRIFRSLSIIILLNVGGYYFCVAFMLFVRRNLNPTDPIISWTIFMVVAILTVNVSAASNGPVLYMTSVEYQKAFQHEFGKICGFIYNSNNLSTTQLHLVFRPNCTR